MNVSPLQPHNESQPDEQTLSQYAEHTRKSLIARLENWEDQRTWDEFYRTYWRLIYSVALKAGLREDEAWDQEMKRGHYHVGEGITGHVAETGRPHVIEDISRDSRFLNRTRTRKSGEKVAFICVPIIHLQQVIGTLSIDRAVAVNNSFNPVFKLSSEPLTEVIVRL